MGEMSKLGWLIGLVKHAIWTDSLYFLYLLLTFNFQNPSFIPAYPMTLFIGMLGQFWFLWKILFEVVPVFMEPHG
jgi:hypothetical protein